MEGLYRIDENKRTKLSKGQVCLFIGHSEPIKVYQVWDTEENLIVVTGSVNLNEQPPDFHRTVVYGQGNHGQSLAWKNDLADCVYIPGRFPKKP